MTRTEMMTKACQTFGLENEWVIAFCKACEEWDYTEQSNAILRTLFECKMKNLAEGIDDEGEV